MAVDRATFLAAHPEFAQVDTDVVDAQLAEAHIEWNETTCGAHYDGIVMLATCVKLEFHPRGKTPRLKGKAAASPSRYERLLKMKVRAAVPMGARSTSTLTSV